LLTLDVTKDILIELHVAAAEGDGPDRFECLLNS
jgi:hypothetical protein